MLKKNAYVPEKQVFYNGRWINKKYFRAYVYNETDEKLANTYDEYEKLIGSGLWVSDKKDLHLLKSKKGKLKDADTNS
jgi:hypothetical protein